LYKTSPQSLTLSILPHDVAALRPIALNGLHLRRPTAYRKPLMAGHPLGGLMRRPTRLAGGCGQDDLMPYIQSFSACLPFMQMRCYMMDWAPRSQRAARMPSP